MQHASSVDFRTSPVVFITTLSEPEAIQRMRQLGNSVFAYKNQALSKQLTGTVQTTFPFASVCIRVSSQDGA
jgi:hypothetical protein